MSEDTPRRQSRGKQTKSYRVEEEYSFLDEEVGSVASRAQTTDHEDEQDDADDVDEFKPDAEEEEELEADLEEDIVATSSSEDEDVEDVQADDDGRPFTPELKIVELHSDQPPASSGHRRLVSQTLNSTPGAKAKVPNQTTRGGSTSAQASAVEPSRSRGITDFTKIGGQEARLKHLFGSTDEDVKRILFTRDHWAAQETLPLNKPGSQRRSFFYDASTQEKERATTRDWYTQEGREAFTNTQESKNLSAEEAAVYLATTGTDSIDVLWGTLDEPQIYTLKKFSYINVAEPFEEKKNRRGWLFHLGSRIQDAQWATREEGSVQYLAVAVEQKATGSEQPKSMENPKAPAFTAEEPFPASIQIWAVDGDEHGRLDVSKQPRLKLVICTDWGAPKQFRWCPVDIDMTSTVTGESNDDHIGMLAGIWSDGRVRILDITISSSETSSTETQYLHYSRAAFDIAIPQTVPSCLRWLSGTTLGVATAMGTLAIWTLSRPHTFPSPQPSTHSPKPWFYQQLSDTYIVTLSSGWPSQPQFVSITTADGFTRLFDIRTPNADNVASIRGRTICVTQDWHEHTQSFVAPDEYYMFKHNPIRRYYHNLYSMRADSIITRCATSPVHPGILIGGADGRVETSNPIGRITNYKVIPWQQTWFTHEWRRPVDDLITESTEDVAQMTEGGPVGGEEASTGPTPTGTQYSSVPREFLDKPLVRILEGYKAFQPGIQHSVTSKKAKNPELGKGLTIYEEASAITVLAWNPNVKFGTWAVAGMGDGLLRVEDVGV
ncbi:hypothetical protein DE146DRAFT_654090 [Phaeosphaeria sp. MPI-PUGE-AT-0046c]|nr:hypothetical protein DE146DRAFT_654090 [Phaeosphaeria sp. MPI-PUGE-AT-0046c]